MLKQTMKHKFLRDLSGNVARGRMRNARNGKPSGLAGFGYVRTENGDREIHDENKTTLRAIRDKIVAGAPTREIVEWLWDIGVPAPRGGRWNPTTLTEMMRSPLYLGITEQNKTSQSKYLQHNPDRKTLTRPESD